MMCFVISFASIGCLNEACGYVCVFMFGEKDPMVQINEETGGEEALTSQMDDKLYSICQNTLDVQL